MSSKSSRSNRRQHHFRVIARGIRRPQPNIPRLMQVSLEMYLAEQERAAQTETQSDADAPDASIEGADR